MFDANARDTRTHGIAAEGGDTQTGVSERHTGDFIGGRSRSAIAAQQRAIGEAISIATSTLVALGEDARVTRIIENRHNAVVRIHVGEEGGDVSARVSETALCALRAALGREATAAIETDRWYGRSEIVLCVHFGEPSVFDEVHPIARKAFVTLAVVGMIVAGISFFLALENAPMSGVAFAEAFEFPWPNA